MKTPHTKFYVVRHGETEWNQKKIVQGQKDSPLTKKGIQEVEELTMKLKDIQFDKVFSSDLPRARKSAKILSHKRNLAVKTSKLIREQNFGIYEGMLRVDFFKLFSEWELLGESEKHSYKLSKDTESNEESAVRLIRFIKKTALLNVGKNILIVCHGGIMKYLVIHLGHMRYNEFQAFDNTGYLILDSDGNDIDILEVNGLHKYR